MIMIPVVIVRGRRCDNGFVVMMIGFVVIVGVAGLLGMARLFGMSVFGGVSMFVVVLVSGMSVGIMMVVKAGGAFFNGLGMLVEQVEAFHVDKQRAIVGRAGRLQDADDLEGVMLVAVPFVRQAMSWLKLVTDFEPGLFGDRGPDHGFEEMLLLEIAAAGLKLIFLAAGVFQLLEQIRHRADDAKAFVVVAQAIRDRGLHVGGEFPL